MKGTAILSSILAAVGVLGFSAFAQDHAKLQCPATRVIASANAVTDGDEVTFQVELTGGNVDRSKLEYHWTVDRGKIVSGQGSPVVFVSTSGEGSAGSVTATVDISPYRDCCWVASESVYVRRKGQRTNADLFWEWMWFNGAQVQYADLPENSSIQTDIREWLDQIDPNLTLDIGPKGEGGKRDLIVGYMGETYDSKAVADFVARAPNKIVHKIVFKNTSIP